MEHFVQLNIRPTRQSHKPYHNVQIITSKSPLVTMDEEYVIDVYDEKENDSSRIADEIKALVSEILRQVGYEEFDKARSLYKFKTRQDPNKALILSIKDTEFSLGTFSRENPSQTTTLTVTTISTGVQTKIALLITIKEFIEKELGYISNLKNIDDEWELTIRKPTLN